MSVYGLVAACLSIVAVVVALLLSNTALKGQDPKTAGALYNFLDLNGSKFEVLLKAFYISITVYYVLMLPTAFSSGNFLIGFKNLVQMLLINVVGTRVFFEGMMLVYRTYVQVVALNKHLGVKAPEMQPIYQQPTAPAAPVAQSAYQQPAAPVAPVSQPVYQQTAAPAAPAVPVPVPEPVAQQPAAPAAPAAEPVTTFVAPTAAPVAETSGPKVCLGCGKPIKDGVKFCPYCGTNQ